MELVKLLQLRRLFSHFLSENRVETHKDIKLLSQTSQLEAHIIGSDIYVENLIDETRQSIRKQMKFYNKNKKTN